LIVGVLFNYRPQGQVLAFTLGCDDPLKVAYLFTGFMAESARSSLSKLTKIEQCQSMSSF
ncbi:hypothetical protein PN462_12280, partial [Spirulina sp. CS-785/01]|uniref:hypothetical protein n=1 Tax=Spirulina sp. CS-785/01 TaxID=3021716 RepID=UPI0023300EEB